MTNTVFGKFDSKRHVWQYQLCMELQVVGLVVSEKRIFKSILILSQYRGADM